MIDSDVLVSIVIPAYNAEKYLRDTVESVLQQTFKDIEIIIVIDGATDGSLNIANSFALENVVVVNKSNTGVSDSRNFGIEMAKGKYIALLDADDLWLPENIEKKIALLLKTNADWVYSDYVEFDDNKKEINKTFSLPKNLLESLLLWEGKVATAPSGLIFKKDVFKLIAFDSEFSTAADQDFCFYLAANYSGVHLSEATWKYRVLENSMSRNIMNMEIDHVAVYKKAAKNNLFSSWAFKRRCFANLFLILSGSWWVNGKKRKRAILFIVKAIVSAPFYTFVSVLKKIIKRR